MDTIEITIDDTLFLDALNQLQQAETDMVPVMLQIAETMRDMIGDAFEQEFDPETGEPWAPLDPKTIDARTKQGTWPGQILQVAGQLANSIHSEHGTDYAVVGSNMVYAPHHHFGSKPEWHFNIPARPFLGVSEEGHHEILEIIQNHFHAATA